MPTWNPRAVSPPLVVATVLLGTLPVWLPRIVGDTPRRPAPHPAPTVAAPEAGPIDYDVTLSRDHLQVAVQVPGSTQGYVQMRLHEADAEAAFVVEALRAVDHSGQPVSVSRADEHGWVIGAGGRPFTLHYRARPQTTPGGLHPHAPRLTPEYALFATDIGLLRPFHPPDLEATPCRVRLKSTHYPESMMTWGPSASRNAASLKDGVIAAGAFRHLERHGGRPLRFSFARQLPEAEDAALLADFTRFDAEQRRWLPPLPATPLQVIVAPMEQGGGFTQPGVVVLYRSPSGGDPLDGRLTLAHELIHQWNGLAIRHAPETGWFSEGATSYLAWLTLLRSHSMTETQAFNELNTTLTEANTTALAGPPLSTAAHQLAKEDAVRLHYRRGMLVSLLADLRIRTLSDGRQGLESLLPLLLRDSANHAPMSNALIRQRLEQLTGRSWAAFFTDLVDGDRPSRLLEALREAGLSVLIVPYRWAAIGVDLGGGGAVRHVEPDSGLSRAGLRAGDRLFEVDLTPDAAGLARATVSRDGRQRSLLFSPPAGIRTRPAFQSLAGYHRAIARLRETPPQ